MGAAALVVLVSGSGSVVVLVLCFVLSAAAVFLVGWTAHWPLWVDFEAKNLLDDRTLEDVFQYPLPGFSFAVIARARL